MVLFNQFPTDFKIVRVDCEGERVGKHEVKTLFVPALTLPNTLLQHTLILIIANTMFVLFASQIIF